MKKYLSMLLVVALFCVVPLLGAQAGPDKSVEILDSAVFPDGRPAVYILPNYTFTFDGAAQCFTSYDEDTDAIFFGKDTWGIVPDITGLLSSDVLFCTAVHNGRANGRVNGYEKDMEACFEFKYENNRTDVVSMQLEFDLYMNRADSAYAGLSLEFRAGRSGIWTTAYTGTAFPAGEDERFGYIETTGGEVMHIAYDLSKPQTILTWLTGTEIWGSPTYPALYFRLMYNTGDERPPSDGEIYGAYIDNLQLTVAYEEPVQDAQSVDITKSKLQLTVGQSETLTATVYPENTTDKSLSWHTDDPSVVTIDEKGTVTAVGAGFTWVYARNDATGMDDSCKVTVSDSQPETGTAADEADITITISPSDDNDVQTEQAQDGDFQYDAWLTDAIAKALGFTDFELLSQFYGYGEPEKVVMRAGMIDTNDAGVRHDVRYREGSLIYANDELTAEFTDDQINELIKKLDAIFPFAYFDQLPGEYTYVELIFAQSFAGKTRTPSFLVMGNDFNLAIERYEDLDYYAGVIDLRDYITSDIDNMNYALISGWHEGSRVSIDCQFCASDIYTTVTLTPTADTLADFVAVPEAGQTGSSDGGTTGENAQNDDYYDYDVEPDVKEIELYGERFENVLDVGALPAGWEIVYNGAGDSEQYVYEEFEGEYFLILNGRRNWSAVVRYELAPLPSKVSLFFDARIPQGGGVKIGNGTWVAGIGAQGHADEWASYYFSIDFAGGTYSVMVDAEWEILHAQMPAQDPDKAWAVFTDHPAIVLDTGNASNGVCLMIDNILLLQDFE